jgi:hypothetical protein
MCCGSSFAATRLQQQQQGAQQPWRQQQAMLQAMPLALAMCCGRSVQELQVLQRQWRQQ